MMFCSSAALDSRISVSGFTKGPEVMHVGAFERRVACCVLHSSSQPICTLQYRSVHAAPHTCTCNLQHSISVHCMMTQLLEASLSSARLGTTAQRHRGNFTQQMHDSNCLWVGLAALSSRECTSTQGQDARNLLIEVPFSKCVCLA